MPATRHSQRGFLRALLGWLIVGGLIFVAFQWSTQRERAKHGESVSLLPGLSACADPFPSAGAMTPPPAGGSRGD